MKPTKIFLILIAAALLPNISYAGTDNISASFERGLHCKLTVTTVVIADMGKKADPMEAAVSDMVDSTTDSVLASYYRDLYRESPSFPTEQFIRTADPYVDAITLAMYDEIEPEPRLVC